jgi:hypothetical protein
VDFFGKFQGLGNTISGFNLLDNSADSPVALFQEITGVVRDLGVVGANIQAPVTGGSGSVIGTLAARVGFGGTVIHCFATGQVSAGNGAVVGGLVGWTAALIVQSHSNVAVSAGSNSIVGGLVGETYDALIEQSYTTGAVSAGDGSTAGGLVGWNNGPDFGSFGIVDSYATGAAQAGNSAFVGGLVGNNEQMFRTDAKIQSTYSVGLTGGGTGSILGGLIGVDMSGSQIADAYWDLDTSGVSNPHQGAGNVPDDPGIAGLTDAQLKSGLPAGFDPSLWAQNPKINNDYPYLLANPPPK